MKQDAGGSHYNNGFPPPGQRHGGQMHCQLKDTLHARDAASTWADHLPWVILGLCAAPKDESGVSALEASLGQSLVIPGQPKAPEGAVPATLHTCTHAVSPSPLDLAEWVYVRRGTAGTPLQTSRRAPSMCCPTGRSSSSSRWGRGRTSSAEIDSSLTGQ